MKKLKSILRYVAVFIIISHIPIQSAQDPYRVLGISWTSNRAEIKKAYQALARKQHPDKGGSTAKFQEIQQAYETLMSTPIFEYQALLKERPFNIEKWQDFYMHKLPQNNSYENVRNQVEMFILAAQGLPLTLEQKNTIILTRDHLALFNFLAQKQLAAAKRNITPFIASLKTGTPSASLANDIIQLRSFTPLINDQFVDISTQIFKTLAQEKSKGTTYSDRDNLIFEALEDNVLAMEKEIDEMNNKNNQLTKYDKSARANIIYLKKESPAVSPAKIEQLKEYVQQSKVGGWKKPSQKIMDKLSKFNFSKPKA